MNPAVLFLFLLSAPVAGCALRSGAQAGEEPRSRVDMALGHFGITPPAFLRSLRFALAGSERPCFSLYQERRRQR